MELFETIDYRNYLRHKVKAGGAGWGLVTKMAQAAGCQRSHLSRVINAHSNLTSDQAYGLTQCWNFDASRTEYFLKLTELARAGTKAYRERLESELRALRKKHERLSDRLGVEPAKLGEKEAAYYGAWYFSAIHIIVSIPEFRTSAAIARRLELPREVVDTCLKQLKDMELIRERAGKWEFTLSSIHLPPESPYLQMHHSNWRQRALIAARHPNRDGVHYSVVQSVSHRDYIRIKEHFLGAIDQYKMFAEPSEPESLIGLNIDFFQV
jgi:uncharacterized protein (TIGR02147 family)